MGLDELMNEARSLKSDSTDIQGMLHLRLQIAGELDYLGTRLGEARKSMMIAKAIYEGKKTQLRVEHLPSGVGYAEAVSRANTAIQHSTFCEADGDFHILKYEYDSAKEMLNALLQKISWAKEDEKYQRFLSNV